MEPEYTTHTGDLGDWTLAVYICPKCGREWYDDDNSPEPEYCPYCGE